MASLHPSPLPAGRSPGPSYSAAGTAQFLLPIPAPVSKDREAADGPATSPRADRRGGCRPAPLPLHLHRPITTTPVGYVRTPNPWLVVCFCPNGSSPCPIGAEIPG